MTDLLEKMKKAAGSLTVNTTLISLVLYILGYLAIRFHLTALGLGTDLAIVDERYLFTGARFVIYLLATVPTLLLLIIVGVVAVHLPYRLFPKMLREKISGRIETLWQRVKTWWSTPDRLAIAAIIGSVLMIQFVMRQSFFLTICWSPTSYLRAPSGFARY